MTLSPNQPKSLYSTCRICAAATLETTLDLGPQPVSSHFARSADGAGVTHNLALGACHSCGCVQLVAPFPFRDLVPPFDWITYREPEEHLDAVVAHTLKICALPPGAKILGLSFKDRTMLERLARAGAGSTRVIDLAHDLGADSPNANIESVPGLLTLAAAHRIRGERSGADLIVARHVLEHAENPGAFLAALSALLAPGGSLVLEVPDCTANLQRQDYTMLWEEHVTYFTRETLPQVLTACGLVCVGLETHAFPFEDVLVLTARKSALASNAVGSAAPNTQAEAVARNVALARAYGAAFADWTARYNALFQRLTADGRKLAIYGAGHLTAAFVNFHRLQRHFAFVVDDTPQKQGLFLPGCGLPILPRSHLTTDTIAACLMGLAPQSEDKVIANNAAFRDAGGAFYSAFVDSRRSIRHLLA